MPITYSNLRSVEDDARASRGEQAPAARIGRARRLRAAATLSVLESIAGLLVLAAWLSLFAAGILVDTLPYRWAISPTGAEALAAEGAAGLSEDTVKAVAARAATIPPALAWFVVLTAFVPLNLAWLCVAASTLGAFGTIANLSDDEGSGSSRDSTHPYTSAILRGFFVYLFTMSGLLLLDDSPFTNAGPSQYIRLAGFLSIFSFVVSYQPRLFTALILSAFQRLQARGIDNGHAGGAQIEADSVHANVDVKRGTVDVAVIKQSTAEKPVDHERDRDG